MVIFDSEILQQKEEDRQRSQFVHCLYDVPRFGANEIGQRRDTIKLIQKKSNKDFYKRLRVVIHWAVSYEERRLNYKPFVTLKDVETYKSSKSAVLQASDDDHSIDSVLQLGVLLSFTVSETKLSDENIEKNNNNHGHVGKKNKDCQPAVNKKKKKKK